MQIDRIKPEQFPNGRGSRHKSSSAFWDLVNMVKALKIGEDPIRVTSIGKSKTSAHSLRAALLGELSHKAVAYKVETHADKDGTYNLFIARFRP